MNELCKNPKFNADGSIDIEVNHPSLGWIPFTASPTDTESHGLLIYQAALAGAYGEVMPYVKTLEEITDEVLAERDRQVYEIDQIAMNPIRWSALSDAEQQALSSARNDLISIETQAGFPTDIIWPTVPDL